VFGDVLAGSFVAVLASVVGPLLVEAFAGSALTPRAGALVYALSAGLGGFVGGMMSRQAEWLRGAGVGVLLVAYQQYRASLVSDAIAGPLPVLALPAAVAGALVSGWMTAAGRQEWWIQARGRVATMVTALRVAGATIAAAALLAPSAAPGLMAVGFAGFLLFLFAGLLKLPLETAAIFMEDKCRHRRQSL
jgi:hypothetical protein